MAVKPLEDSFYSKNMFVDEIRRKGIVITKSPGVLNITIATITVYNAPDDRRLIAPANCTINNDNGQVYAYINAGQSAGIRYAIIAYTDGNHHGKARLDYRVVR